MEAYRAEAILKKARQKAILFSWLSSRIRHPVHLEKKGLQVTLSGHPTKSVSIGPSDPISAIFAISVLSLFLEMLFIRWIGTEVRIFAYLQNIVLVTCFLGLGLGCFTSREPIEIRKSLWPLLFLVLLLTIPIARKGLGKTSELLSVLGDFVIWHHAISESPLQTVLFVILGLFLTYLLMVVILDIFVSIGRLLGRLMDGHPNTIWAYSVNVGGSLAGTWLFVLLSGLNQPPVVWFAVTSGLLLFFIGNRQRRGWGLNVILLCGIVGLSWFASFEFASLETLWSPYQKLSITKADPSKGQIGTYVLEVNNTAYQVLLDLNEQHVRADSAHFPAELRGFSQYDIPLLLHPNPRTVLIVGAGTGNDVAAALRHGATKVTAVEIDPVILRIGRAYHPESPYASPLVKTVTDDARSFFATCKERYDVISFGLLDSHTTTAMTNARLDHYVYTRESFERAKSLLSPGGVMVVSFEAQKPFIADRMSKVIGEIFGKEPISFRVPSSSYGWGGVLFVTGDQGTAVQQIERNKHLASLINRWQQEFPLELTHRTPVATDDWPYIYLRSRSVPTLCYLLAGLMILLFIRSLRHWNATGLFARWRGSHWHFFFLGAAFMLLEVQNISKSSVVLGNTWMVNAVIVSGVLVMILLANLIAARFPNVSLVPVYVSLFGICLVLYFVDLSRFAFLPHATKALFVGSLTTLPVIFSGFVFIRSFADVNGKDEALGANLIGALVGALLQSITFVTGIKALLLVVLGLYVLALLTRPRIAASPAPRSSIP